VSWKERFSVLSCSGLLNRGADTPVYTFLGNPHDSWSDDRAWLKNTENITETPSLTDPDQFLTMCFKDERVDGRYIKYNSTYQQALLPSIATLAGVLSAVPIDIESQQVPSTATVLAFDAVTIFAGYTPAQAVLYVYERYVNLTTALSWDDPGYELQSGKAILHPNITRAPLIEQMDYIVKTRVFSLYLPEGCVPFTEQHRVLKTVVENNPWPKPLAVLGYDRTVVFAGGAFFEDETLCDLKVGMGQVATALVNNLAYFSRQPPISKPLPVNPPPDRGMSYNASKSYISFVIGDGDNVAMLKSTRRKWMEV